MKDLDSPSSVSTTDEDTSDSSFYSDHQHHQDAGSEVSCYFLYDLGKTETKEDVLVLLANISRQYGHGDPARHDEEVRNGTAKHLARCLHRLITYLSGPPEKNYNHHPKQQHYRTKLEPTRALQMTATCRALELVLQGSLPVLEEYMSELSKDLSACLPRVISLFASNHDSLVRLSGLTSSIRIVATVGPLLPPTETPTLVRSLLLLVVSHQHQHYHQQQQHQQVPSDIRVDAALAVTRLLNNRRRSIDMVEIIEEHASTLISILSTGAMSVWEQFEDCLGGLVCLARFTPALAAKLARRRCVILAIRKYLLLQYNLHQNHHLNLVIAQTHSIELAKALLETSHCRANTTTYALTTTAMVKDNMELLTSAVMRALLQKETDPSSPETKLALMEILATLVQKDLVEASQMGTIMNALYFFAASSAADDDNAPEDMVLRAASIYLDTVRVHENAGILVCTVDLLSSPIAKVRQQTFQVLLDLCFWKVSAAKFLLSKSALLDHLSWILTRASKEDCTSAVKICKQLVIVHQDTHATFCVHSGFLSSLVAIVTQVPVTNRLAYGDAVDVLLELMSADHIHLFTPNSVLLLPWLVKFANITSDDDLKKRAVESIVRYSSVLLHAD